MGGSRQGLFKTLRNLLIAMALVGLWHGAAWTFVLWGVYHGILLCIQRLWRHLIAIRLHASFQIPLMLVAVMIGWVFFRAETLSDIAVIFQSLLGITLEQFVQSLTTDGRLFAVAIVFFLLTLCIQVMEASEGWRERYRRVTAVSVTWGPGRRHLLGGDHVPRENRRRSSTSSSEAKVPGRTTINHPSAPVFAPPPTYVTNDSDRLTFQRKTSGLVPGARPHHSARPRGRHPRVHREACDAWRRRSRSL